MTQSVNLADEIMAAVRKEAELQGRSVADQITHWLRIGRTIEKSMNFDYQRIIAALDAALSPDELRPEEQEVWFDQFVMKMAEPRTQEKVFHDMQRKLGRGVGLTSSGSLIYQKETVR